MRPLAVRRSAEDTSSGEFGDGSRLQQITEWLGDGDYLVVFDECHKAKNCMPDVKKDVKESKTSRAVQVLQHRLPNARVLYVSATGQWQCQHTAHLFHVCTA